MVCLWPLQKHAARGGESMLQAEGLHYERGLFSVSSTWYGCAVNCDSEPQRCVCRWPRIHSLQLPKGCIPPVDTVAAWISWQGQQKSRTILCCLDSPWQISITWRPVPWVQGILNSQFFCKCYWIHNFSSVNVIKRLWAIKGACNLQW